MLRWGRFALGYAFLGVLSAVVAVVLRSGSPFAHPTPLLALAEPARHTYSLMMGITIGALIVVSTRITVARFEWARRLHSELRPIARAMTTPGILVLAVLSALGEELLFRGLLQPWVGIVPQALAFGFLHQVRGPSRYVWMAWATAVGLVLGAIFQITGSLLGPIMAHAVVNGLNLAYLKSHDPAPNRRALGGLLG